MIVQPPKEDNKQDIPCPSSHGTKGFRDGTTFDESLGVYVCACGRQFRSELEPEPKNPHYSGVKKIKSYGLE